MACCSGPWLSLAACMLAPGVWGVGLSAENEWQQLWAEVKDRFHLTPPETISRQQLGRFAHPKLLGHGVSGLVVRAEDSTHAGRWVALKFSVGPADHYEEELRRECAALRNIHAQGRSREEKRLASRIIQCFEDFSKGGFIVLEHWGDKDFMEYAAEELQRSSTAEAENLDREALQKQEKLDREALQSMWDQLQEALKFMQLEDHQCRWGHGDIGPRNVRVDTKHPGGAKMKLIDFGAAFPLNEKPELAAEDAKKTASLLFPGDYPWDWADIFTGTEKMFVGSVEECKRGQCVEPNDWLEDKEFRLDPDASIQKVPAAKAPLAQPAD